MKSLTDMKLSILNAVADLIDSALEKADFAIVVKAIVTEVKGKGKYTVRINNVNYEATSRFEISVGETVYVVKPNDKYKNMVIVG